MERGERRNDNKNVLIFKEANSIAVEGLSQKVRSNTYNLGK